MPPRIGQRALTNAEKQARYRMRSRLLREAWEEVLKVTSARQAHEIARRVLGVAGKGKNDE